MSFVDDLVTLIGLNAALGLWLTAGLWRVGARQARQTETSWVRTVLYLGPIFWCLIAAGYLLRRGRGPFPK